MKVRSLRWTKSSSTSQTKEWVRKATGNLGRSKTTKTKSANCIPTDRSTWIKWKKSRNGKSQWPPPKAKKERSRWRVSKWIGKSATTMTIKNFTSNKSNLRIRIHISNLKKLIPLNNSIPIVAFHALDPYSRNFLLIANMKPRPKSRKVVKTKNLKTLP